MTAELGALRDGRSASTLCARAAGIVFGADTGPAMAAELDRITAVDQAHVVMLAERELIGPAAAAELLREIQFLRADDFAELRGRRAPRGLYLLYESHLIERLGREIGGVLHTGRSRNDLKATVHKLRLRAVLAGLVRELLRLQAVTLGRARRHRVTVMPVYSQFQPSVPGSYGWYLLGIAEALDHDIDGLVRAGEGLRECPLGAAGGAGTDVRLDPARTADLLGFTEPVRHAGYAIASRDTMLRILSAAVLAGLTLSRLATDLQLWSTPEFDLVEFPDHLVGISSAMPQKRNPFLLEVIKGASGALIGAWTAAVATTKNTPFGNSVEVSTEGVAPGWAALDTLGDQVQLSISVLAGARPRPERMLAGAHHGYTVATAIANRLVAQGVPFRSAHTATGRLVTELIAEGVTSFAAVPPGELAARLGAALGTEVRLGAADLDPAEVVRATDFGGGPGARSFALAHTRLARRWRVQVRQLTAEERRRRTARRRRARAVTALIDGRAEARRPGNGGRP
ncbi:argininosuccinate lyase [Amycolatopsis mediterranei S699]|uniref:argininosuccinate lyase n=3 Tax=Amycolatopsis mediterranei TaxID=33910 RepID=A0A0H3D886_AMYMU|nr:argininosuccinate lyase [Amycolatopsis mediterranei]ADJ46527.1 argininosuccinate lyase [Amycolatopsis mediterranei U32]AEK43327.1 argininosuccinate lyase [Amycolatopsis mediterranei S699]AFO78238.1 argininosuccinate lyase [Amycolatopsis mediterranei S699]AGT85366.1 argininosuccinate lyase [Amycolatopsis mediterranei RB]KDO06184.1 argininosuccinate lyase [Amycolatopsis mediterranei]